MPPPPPTHWPATAARPPVSPERVVQQRPARAAVPPPPVPTPGRPAAAPPTLQAKPAFAGRPVPPPAPAKTIQKMDIDSGVTFGFSGFSRPDFQSGVSKVVTNDVNQWMSDNNYNPVLRTNYDIAHKVPYEAIRNKVMSFIYTGGSTDKNDLIAKTKSLYTQNKTRYGHMKQKRQTLFDLIDHYGYMNKGPMLIMDAANALLGELNSAYDNLGFGIPSENRSIGGNPDPTITAWDPNTRTVTYSPRSDAIDDQWNLTRGLLYDQNGHPRSSQVTSYFN